MPGRPFFTSLLAADNTSDLQTMNGHEVLEPNSQLHIKPICILLLIIGGKCIMNLFLFGARNQKTSASFLGYFCVSLAVVDITHLFVISAVHYFQDFSFLGVRVTSYHICLVTQIISHAYGILHLPVFLAAGLDYYLKIVKSRNGSRTCLMRMLYITLVLLFWIAAFTYVLKSPLDSPEVYNMEYSHLCTFYTSSQSFFLSAALVSTVCLFLLVSCREIVSFIKSLKAVSYAKSTIFVFSFSSGEKWPIRGGNRLLAALVFSFLGTWGPFAVLQIIILALCTHIPAYMDMNLPWLYFMNSFLIAVALGLRYPDLQVAEKTLSTDPFIEWKYCILPFTYADQGKAGALIDQLMSEVVSV